MIIVKVTYTVNAGFVEQNQQNIAAFMADFREIAGNEFHYNIYLQADGQTFVHLSHFGNKEIQQSALNTASFKRFQQERDNLGLVSPAQIEELSLVDATRSPLE